ncbi:hypothetical protein [Streptomyces sp. NPDC088785]|uniref:hypothetical protein n=1 Tax=Streptomyces sp. NPDC088785 TaxID=3365897 RepID=UPI0038180B3C
MTGTARRALLLPLCGALLLALTACGAGATSEKTVRSLAGGAEAVRARTAAETARRDAIAAWDDDTPLTLGMVVVEDRCAGGEAQELFSSGDDRYEIRCLLYVSAYFGADPRRAADTLDGVLDAGDRETSVIPFGHDFLYARKVVDYYRGRTGDPQGPGTGEPSELDAAGDVTLDWDQVRGAGTRRLIEEPRPCAPHAPPVRRCLREPAGADVAALRRTYGMVFRLTFLTDGYFTVWRK